MNTNELPPSLPNLSGRDYSVTVRLLDTPSATIFIETEAEIKARFRDLDGALAVDYATKPDDLSKARAEVAILRDNELSVMQSLTEQYGDQVKEYTFRFRIARNKDVREAELSAAVPPPAPGEEAEAARQTELPVRLRPAFRETLARLTLLGHNYNGSPFPQTDADFSELDNDIAERVLEAVRRRVSLSGAAASFLGT